MAGILVAFSVGIIVGGVAVAVMCSSQPSGTNVMSQEWINHNLYRHGKQEPTWH